MIASLLRDYRNMASVRSPHLKAILWLWCVTNGKKLGDTKISKFTCFLRRYSRPCVREHQYILSGGQTIFLSMSFRQYYCFSEINIYYVDSPQYIKDALSDVSQGRRAASVTTVEGAGHMASPQLYFNLYNLLTPLSVWPRSSKNNLTRWHR